MIENLNEYIDKIEDFPKPGILFRDISPLLRMKFSEAIDAMSELFSTTEWNQTQLIAGIESRGFIFASALAYKHQKGFVKIRKPGKLPKAMGKVEYSLEYGSNSLEIQQGNSEKLIIIDDLLATGGSMAAAAELAQKVNYELIGLATFINLADLNSFYWHGINCRSVLHL